MILLTLISWLKDEDSGIVLELQGAWARAVVLPGTSSKLTVSLEGAVLEQKEGASAVVGAVFAGGIKMKWAKESVDGFHRESRTCGRGRRGRGER